MHLIAQDFLLRSIGLARLGFKPGERLARKLDPLQILEIQHGLSETAGAKKNGDAHLGGFARAELAVQFVECQGCVAPRRIGALTGDVTDTRSGHADFLGDLGQFESRFLQVSDSLCPFVHGGESTVSRNHCQRPPVTEFRLNAIMAKQPPNIGFCERVRERRRELGLDRHVLANLSGLKYSTIADIENKHSYSSRRIDALARALQTTAEYLRDGIKASVTTAPILSEREQDLVDAYRLLTEPDRRELAGFIKGLSKKRLGKIRRIESAPDRVVRLARK